MVQAELLKGLVRPPFANYDLVVYFGCGLFSLPFIMHYLGQHQIHFLSLDISLEPPFVGALVTTLVLLFSVYILGHIIAYTSSQFIEKAADSIFGKVSSVILLCSASDNASLSTIMRRQIQHGYRVYFSNTGWIPLLVRFGAHFPVWLAYLLVYMLGFFGFYRSRVPSSVVVAAKSKFDELNLPNAVISKNSKWFKSLEAYVINNYTVATARMYNYLIISGLFRSVSLILLGSLWFEMSYLFLHITIGRGPEGMLMFGIDTIGAQIFSYVIIVVVYMFSVFSFLKFQRRYVEEAIFAFVFTKE